MIHLGINTGKIGSVETITRILFQVIIKDIIIVSLVLVQDQDQLIHQLLHNLLNQLQ